MRLKELRGIMESGIVRNFTILYRLQNRDMRKGLISNHPLDRYCIVCTPKGNGVKTTLLFPEFLNTDFVSVIGHLVKLGVNTGIEIRSRRIVTYSLK